MPTISANFRHAVPFNVRNDPTVTNKCGDEKRASRECELLGGPRKMADQ
jgi:hypothetical protein